MSSLSRELVFLILQFLDEEKFKETVHKLEQESGFFFNMKYFEDQIQAGEWDEVERYLSGFTKVEDNHYSMKIFFEIRKQKYLEALDRQDRAKAVEIFVKDLKVFSSFSEDLFKITQLPTLDNFRQNEQLSKYGNTKSARNVMLVELKNLIEANPLFRDKLTLPSFEASHLRTLINQRDEIIEEKEMHKVKDQRSRSSRLTTIHGFAQYGDLVALQKLLQDNPSLLNDRNPVMAETPLHVSAGYNNVEIMQYLLDWPGAEKVELEAKNTYGETPLHMAAKNGCNEAVKMLLARGAFVEAEANNGMTPLHLAVRESLRSEDYSTVKTLLESDADGSAEDNMAETPLHVSAGYNNVEIMQYLLDRPGAEKVELEAKNTDGETPLHMAAKNGCNEAVKVLLARGAFVEAEANNGMNSLHLAVRHSLRSEDYSTVKTLLESGADGSAEDNEGMTPLNHLSQGQGSEKLRELLHKHLEEQRKRRAIEACNEMKAKMDALENELANIMGLHSLKLQLRKWAKGMLLDEERRALGLEVGPRRPPHMAFLGNPGTGKTMFARILGKLLHMLGILPTDKVTEVQRTDLVGKYHGHTGPKTRRKIREAEGGILFVDEAYRLIPKRKDWGMEALEEIMSVMDSGKIVVIFAGYSKPMKRVISSNEGFKRRVTKFFHFDDFSSEDLAKILHLKMSKQDEGSLLYGFKLHSSCSVDAIAEVIERETTEKQRKEMNGGLVDPMLVNARENLDLRLNSGCTDTDDLLTIMLEDLEAGLRLLKQ